MKRCSQPLYYVDNECLSLYDCLNKQRKCNTFLSEKTNKKNKNHHDFMIIQLTMAGEIL